jgi:hypothetical protein
MASSFQSNFVRNFATPIEFTTNFDVTLATENLRLAMLGGTLINLEARNASLVGKTRRAFSRGQVFQKGAPYSLS